MKRRILSLFLVIAMLCTIVPAVSAASSFVDVSQSAWYAEAVNYAVENELMNGVGNGKFAPDGSMTRAMLVTVLWRYEGSPIEGANTFNDVPNGQWFTDAVAWAAENGIVGGVGGGKFDPNGNVTREQMAAILFRYAGQKGIDTSDRSPLNFPDASKVSAWATDAIAWTVAAGIIGGSDGKLLPQGNATRAQVSAILMRFIEGVAKNVEFTVTFETNGGSAIEAQKVKVGTTAAEPEKPAYEGYIFTGWYADKELTKPYDFKTPVTENLTLYASWTVVTFGVTFESNGGSEVDPVIVAYGATLAEPEKPTYEGYIFTGWYADKELTKAYDFKTPVKEDLTLYASWTVITFGVTFESNGGSEVDPVIVAYGATVPEPEAPTYEGYTFDGWYTDQELTKAFDFSTPVKEDLTLYAAWTKIEEFYTVTFDSLGGSEVEAQTVAHGETAVAPPEPTLEGYTFAGWFLEKDGGGKFDFDTPIKKNLTLYASWLSEGGTDDLGDDEDTDVTATDKYSLSASEKEVLAESGTNVLFYVNSTLTVPYFELYFEGTDTGVKLYDDGDLGNHSDDIPNDGCYTGSYEINIAEERDVQFTAIAVVGEKSVTTEPCKIFVYYELTDDEINEMDEISDKVSEIARGIREKNPSADVDELISKICSEVDLYLNPLVEAKIIDSVSYHAESYAYTWTYTSRGIEDMCFIYSEEDEDIKSYDDSLTDDEVKDVVLDLDMDYSKGNVAILNYYGASHDWSRNYDNIANTLRDAGFSVTCFYDFTCNDFKHLQAYESLIMVDSHGNTFDGTPTGTPIICTNEKQTDEKTEEYSNDILRGRIRTVTLTSGKEVYWIAPELFNFYYSDNKLNSPIVYLGACRDYPDYPNNDTLVRAISNAGASAVLGYDASVGVPYDYDMARTIVDRLLFGDTVDDALQYAKNNIASQDNSFFDSDPGWNKRAELNRFGAGNATMYHLLINGKFDSEESLNGWKQYGDARTIYRLSGIKPQSLPLMAIISSGFGSMDGQTTSCLYQTVLVPDDVTTIEFAYDVVSEEPMEWVGSIYNDFFAAELLDTDGNVLETLAYESVNTSTWFGVEGIDFPGGDETTYHTRWQYIASDAIQKYQGKLIVIRFTVQDAGDSVFDTAVLIDSVRMH